ncbi:hypothetical protein G9A89_003111 [Geosiphon pyriformis]|nr:hypothetical protein G9A89_003111 [Geosiphon pyriformis]
MSDPELTTIVWRHQEWILQQPNGLNSNNVLDYFSESPFWEKHCNNATLKMQTQFNDLKDLMFELKKMRGIEFQVVHERPPCLWVIRKQRRWDESQVTPLATYYVYKADVYQAPDLYSILANRVLISLWSLNMAFNACYEQVDFHPATGYTWKTAESQELKENDKKKIKVIAQESKEATEFRLNTTRALDAANSKIADRRAEALRILNEMATPAGKSADADGISSPHNLPQKRRAAG